VEFEINVEDNKPFHHLSKRVSDRSRNPLSLPFWMEEIGFGREGAAVEEERAAVGGGGGAQRPSGRFDAATLSGGASTGDGDRRQVRVLGGGGTSGPRSLGGGCGGSSRRGNAG
jgi:hypothetical protein